MTFSLRPPPPSQNEKGVRRPRFSALRRARPSGERGRSPARLASARAQDLAMQLFVALAAVVQPRAIYEHMFDPARWHYEAAAAARQVITHLATLVGTNRIVVKGYDVGRHARQQASAIPDAKEIRRFRGDTLNRVFKRHRLPFPHPGAKQIGAIAGIAEHINVGATIAQANHSALVRD